MQVIRVPPGNMSRVLLIRNISPLKDLDHEEGIDYLSKV